MKKKSLRLLLLNLVVFALLSGCTGKQEVPILRDLAELPQDAGAYIQNGAYDPVMSGVESMLAGEDYLERHFSPWHRTESNWGKDKVFWGLKTFDKPKYYAENRKLHSSCWVEEMFDLALVEEYPNANLKAISVATTSMRVLPSIKPAFRDFAKAGEGFPFDYMQNSLVWAQTPLYVSQFSKDGAWALVESSYAYGWVPVRDIAIIDDVDAAAMERDAQGFVSIVRDRTPLADSMGLFRFHARVGMVLPVIGHDPGMFDVLIVVRDSNGRAAFESSVIEEEATLPFPAVPTPMAFALIANEMLGQPYGWGGMYENRDCSAMIRDLYAAFGLWLPRNSKQQAVFGRFTSLADLTDGEKIEYILQRAKPWRTILWKPGHIMLYIGHKDGNPIILHATWGVKTKDNGTEGRYVIGQTVITTLTPGAELDNIAPNSSLLHKLAGMTLLPKL